MNIFLTSAKSLRSDLILSDQKLEFKRLVKTPEPFEGK